MAEQMEYYKYLRQFVGQRPLILPGSVVIIRNKLGEVLLQKRPEGRWGLPGGLMNLGESFEQVAQREVLEEVGLEIKNIKLLQVYSGEENYTKAPNGDEFYSVTAVYTTDEVSGELNSDSNETVDVKYFRMDNLPDQMVGSHKRFIISFKDQWTDL